MSASRVAFLQAICENPDDDTARLVFADWLDEQGDPERAEFIRLQIGIASGSIPEARLATAQARTEELFKRNETAWRGELPVRSGVTWATSPFARGFADTVGFRHGKAWKEDAEAVFATAPVSHLQCGGTFTSRTARPVLASPLIGRLSVLAGIHFDETGAKALASNPHPRHDRAEGRCRCCRLTSSVAVEEPPRWQQPDRRRGSRCARGIPAPVGAAALTPELHQHQDR